MKYRTRQIEVKVRELTSAMSSYDYEILYPDGRIKRMMKDDFEREFEPIPEPSDTDD